jgi:hypothetical protein
LNQKLDQPTTGAVTRQLVEALAPLIRVDTLDQWGQQEARAENTDAFGSVESHTGKGLSSPPS